MKPLPRSLCAFPLPRRTCPAAGCDGTGGDEPNAPPVPGNAGGPRPGWPWKAGPGGAPGKTASSPEIRAIMVKLNKGPSSLGTVIGEALKAEKPAWETIQPQTKEYAQFAADMGKHEPAKGSKESWSKLTAEFAGLANELDKAAQAKDKAAATAAQDDLASSCMACHRQHRGGPGGGMGGMGGRGMGGAQVWVDLPGYAGRADPSGRTRWTSSWRCTGRAKDAALRAGRLCSGRCESRRATARVETRPMIPLAFRASSSPASLSPPKSQPPES